MRSSVRLFPGVRTSGLMLPSLGCSLWSAALRTALCLLDQESSFGSPWLVLPLLPADCWDNVGVGACSLNSVSLTVLFHRPSSKGAFVSPAPLYGCCSDPSSRHLVLGKGEIHSQLGIFTVEMVSVLECLLLSWRLCGLCLNCRLPST